MKKAAKHWFNYLFAFFGVLLVAGTGILLYFVIGEPDWPLLYSFFFMIFGGIILAGGGFIIQDLYRGWNRHKLHNWDNPLPENIIDKAWNVFFPFLTSGLFCFAVGLIAFLIAK